MKTIQRVFASLNLDALRFCRRLPGSPTAEPRRPAPGRAAARRAAGVWLALLATLASASNGFATRDGVLSITCPPPVAGQCASEVPTAATTDAEFIAQGGTITGDCPPFFVTSSDVLVPGACANSFTITRTYTVTDSCTGLEQCQQTITINDTTAPVFTGCPTGPIPLSCNAAPSCADALALGITATDNCDGPITLTTANCSGGAVVPDVGCQVSQTFTLTATDSCGNSANCLVTYTWKIDVTKPVIHDCPGAAFALGCNPQNLPDCATVSGLVTVTDDCDPNLSVNCQAGTPEQTGCDWSQTFTLTATDLCGNAADPCVVTYTWKVDTTSPQFTGCPTAAIPLGCNPVPLKTCADALALVTVNDDCDGPLTPTCQPGEKGRSASAPTGSWPVTGTRPRRPRRRCAAAGCTPAMLAPSMPTAISR